MTLIDDRVGSDPLLTAELAIAGAGRKVGNELSDSIDSGSSCSLKDKTCVQPTGTSLLPSATRAA